MRSLLVGLDVSPLRMGFGVVDLLTGEPITCGMVPIELPKNDWSYLPVARALDDLYVSNHKHGEVQAAYMEQPAFPRQSGPRSAFFAGMAVGIARTEVKRRWPHAPVEMLAPSEWRLLAGLKGNASKDDVTLRAIDLGFGDEVMESQSRSLSWVVPGGQDAADAACIAVAGQRRNGENWSRAVERGAA